MEIKGLDAGMTADRLSSQLGRGAKFVVLIQSVWVNSRGGRDVTRDVAAALGASPPPAAV